MGIEKDHSPLISVVLPTYNVKDYLLQCLDSVKAQTYQNIEVIIIIDGATDGSYEIAKEFCKTDNRFHVYWQENAGSGPARNNGLSHCRGDLVMFVDPDDWIKPDLLEVLVHAQQEHNYDLTPTNRIRVLFSDDNKIIKESGILYPDKNSLEYVSTREMFPTCLKNSTCTSPTNKLYKLSIIRENNIRFPDLRRSQDIVFNIRYYTYVRTIKFVHYNGYMYRVFVSQSSGKAPRDYYKTIQIIYDEIAKMYDEWNIPLPETIIASHFFKASINSYLQKCVIEHWPIENIVSDSVIHHIIKKARPKGLYLNILLLFLKMKNYTLIEIYLRVVIYLKQRNR